MARRNDTDERTVLLAPSEKGGLYPILDEGKRGATSLRVVVAAKPYLRGRAFSIVRRHFPEYRATGAELYLYAKLKKDAAQ